MAFVGAFFGGIGSFLATGTVAGAGAFAAGASVASFFTTSTIGKLLMSVALSALAQALTPRPPQPGIRTSQTLTGGTTPESFILGRYATEGQLIAPPMSHGTVDGVPNALLNYVIELGGVPGQQLESLIIDGEPCGWGDTAVGDYGFPVTGKFAGVAWIKYYDGTQVAADPLLLAKYGADPLRPWSADMVGAGITYAVVTFRFNRTLFNGFPKVRFVLTGIPLYDPRLDDTVGGSGAHRWADPATWAVTENPMVQVYNALRGIALPGGDVWGGGFAAADLPLADWWAAMNACDETVDVSTGGTALRTNLALHSQDLGNAYWTKSEVTITADAADDPLGAATLDKIVETAVTANHAVGRNLAVTSGLVYTFSAVVKAAERSQVSIVFPDSAFPTTVVRFDLSAVTATATTGTPEGMSIEDMGDGLYRVAAWQQANATGSPFVALRLTKAGVMSYAGTLTEGLFAGWMQFEQSDGPTAYMASAAEVGTGGREARYRASYEVYVDEQPADVIEELLKAASAQISESGGVFRPRVGGPGMPVAFFSDDDLLVSESQEFDPFPGLAQTFNAVHATYPEPDSLWESRDAPPRYDDEFEVEDGDRRLVADIALPAVPYAAQVQRLMLAWITEERRFRRHVISLPSGFLALQPLDAVGWTSARNGYDAKVFEVVEVIDPLVTGTPRLSLRERDAADYDWDPVFDQVADTPPEPGAVALPAQGVAGWAVTPVALDDGSADRRPALLLQWDGEQEDVRGLIWEARLDGETDPVLRGSTQDVAAGQLVVTQGVLPAQAYEVRAQFVVDRPVEWSAWVDATAPDVRVDTVDIAPNAVTDLSVSFVSGATDVTSGAYTAVMTEDFAYSGGNVPALVDTSFGFQKTSFAAGSSYSQFDADLRCWLTSDDTDVILLRESTLISAEGAQVAGLTLAGLAAFPDAGTLRVQLRIRFAFGDGGTGIRIGQRTMRVLETKR